MILTTTIHHKVPNTGMLSRAQGCLLGQFAGDALGSLVEFQTPEQIRQEYPNGVRELVDGGNWNTIAGQPTDDSEIALSLARMLVKRGTYNPDAALRAYRDWLDSGPFDCGGTVSSALHDRPNHDSQANGAMMRVSPLGIFEANFELKQVAEWAMQDALLTPHPACCQANALFAMAIARAIATGPKPEDLYHGILTWTNDTDVDQSLMAVIEDAGIARPKNYIQHQGWVLIAFQNALWQLLHASNLEEAVVNTFMRGGDTDTNAAICGALLGPMCGRDAIPEQMDRMLTELPPRGRRGTCTPCTPEVLLAGGYPDTCGTAIEL